MLTQEKGVLHANQKHVFESRILYDIQGVPFVLKDVYFGSKIIYVQHSASNKIIALETSVVNANFGGGKCLTPAMLPADIKIGDEVDSPEGKTKVVDLVRKQREGYYILEDELEITNDHPILIDGEWILAEEYQGKKEYIQGEVEVIYLETENELLTVKGWTVGGKY